tara:strand:+ start:2593 stop:3003 length:411 start_codon:yes stop_codon:yes gene_type:complete
MKYSPFDGTLDRVIEELIEENRSLKFKLDLATQELSRMDDRLALQTSQRRKEEEEEDKYRLLRLGPFVTDVIYSEASGILRYRKAPLNMYVRSGTIRQNLEPDEISDAPTIVQNFDGEQQEDVTITQAVDCDGNPP